MRRQIGGHTSSDATKAKGSTAGRLQRRTLRVWKQDYLHYKYLWPNLEWAARTALERIGSDCPKVLDIGCGHKPYRDLFPGAQHWGMDHGIVDTSPDFVGDALRLPIRDQSVDIVFATQVIEHVTNPHVMVRECKRVLRPNGCLILSGPFFWPLHEEPYDFFRFTKYGFEQLLKDAGFLEWQILEDGGDWARLMLSMCLRLNKWLFPLSCAVNLTGAFLDSVSKSTRLPANYTCGPGFETGGWWGRTPPTPVPCCTDRDMIFMPHFLPRFWDALQGDTRKERPPDATGRCGK